MSPRVRLSTLTWNGKNVVAQRVLNDCCGKKRCCVQVFLCIHVTSNIGSIFLTHSLGTFVCVLLENM